MDRSNRVVDRANGWQTWGVLVLWLTQLATLNYKQMFTFLHLV